MHHGSIAIPLAFILGSAAISCDNQDAASRRAHDYAAAYCDWAFACSCQEYEYHDHAECMLAEAEESTAELELGEHDGRTFDESCFAAMLDTYSDRSCTPNDMGFPQCPYCKLYYGDVPDGGKCDDSWVWDDCAQGLDCDSGTCVDPCRKAAEGESCVTDTGSVLECADGLACNLETNICEPPPGLGDPCDSSIPCAQGVCEYASGTCMKRAAKGESCTGSDCADGLWCDVGDPANPNFDQAVCRSAKTAGSACVLDQECTWYCADGVCVDEPPASCLG